MHFDFFVELSHAYCYIYPPFLYMYICTAAHPGCVNRRQQRGQQGGPMQQHAELEVTYICPGGRVRSGLPDDPRLDPEPDGHVHAPVRGGGAGGRGNSQRRRRSGRDRRLSLPHSCITMHGIF
jgi:hypothetical protein